MFLCHEPIVLGCINFVQRLQFDETRLHPHLKQLLRIESVYVIHFDLPHCFVCTIDNATKSKPFKDLHLVLI